MQKLTSKRMLVASSALLMSLTLAACNNADTTAKDHEGSSQTQNSPSTEESSRGEGERQEVSSLPPRVTYTYDGGIVTLNPLTGRALTTEKMDGLLRLNDAGDGKHVLVTKGDEYLTWDTGLTTVDHGDHKHYYVSEPRLAQGKQEAPKAGHVVVNAGMTSMFSDGTGKAFVTDTSAMDKFADGTAEMKTFDSGAPHHGVAVPLEDGTVVMTKGTEEERHSVIHMNAENHTLTETTDCPGVHGEAVAGNTVVFGCENGPVAFDGTKFHKLDVDGIAGEEGYQRSGNLMGAQGSEVILADNKTDKHAADNDEVERPTSVLLINGTDQSVQKVDLGAAYWFRSLDRGGNGEALVLTDDGKVVVIDPDSGKIERRIQAIDPWQEKDDWQQPGPILKAKGELAYISDPESKELVVLNIATGEEQQRLSLDHAPMELAVN